MELKQQETLKKVYNLYSKTTNEGEKANSKLVLVQAAEKENITFEHLLQLLGIKKAEYLIRRFKIRDGSTGYEISLLRRILAKNKIVRDNIMRFDVTNNYHTFDIELSDKEFEKVSLLFNETIYAFCMLVGEVYDEIVKGYKL